jgi:hypothetical protein
MFYVASSVFGCWVCVWSPALGDGLLDVSGSLFKPASLSTMENRSNALILIGDGKVKPSSLRLSEYFFTFFIPLVCDSSIKYMGIRQTESVLEMWLGRIFEHYC